jgi:hypothetical protein
MSDTDESYVEPITSQLPTPSIESVKADVNPPRASVEVVRLSDNPRPQSPPEPSVDYEKKSL